MLREDQVAELLRRCEAQSGKRLDSTRGNLLEVSSRAAAVWELVCIEAISQLWRVKCEPDYGSRPDLVLEEENTEPIWFEISFLYPREWKIERQKRDFLNWIYQRAGELGVPTHKVSIHFDGKKSARGYIPKLPEQQDRKKVLRSNEIKSFFDQIVRFPETPTSMSVAPYTATIVYDPHDAGPYAHGGGVVEEQPSELGEHALYLKLEEKARQHHPSVPYVICVGSDQSPVLSRWEAHNAVRESDVVGSIFRRFSRISAVLVVSIEDEMAFDRAHSRRAHSRLYVNRQARNPLSNAAAERLRAIDFNRWLYTFQLDKNGAHGAHKFFRSKGPLSVRVSSDSMKVTIPSTVVVDCLAGRTTLAREYGEETERLFSSVYEGWDVLACTVVAGDIQQGIASQVTFELVPPPGRVFRE